MKNHIKLKFVLTENYSKKNKNEKNENKKEIEGNEKKPEIISAKQDHKKIKITENNKNEDYKK